VFTSETSSISKLCLKEKVDGVILVQDSHHCDFRYRIFNADGGEASMCGNGLRCFGDYLRRRYPSQATFTVESCSDQHQIRFQGDLVSVSMGEAKEIAWKHELKDLGIHVDLLDTGVPHAVLIVDDVSNINLEDLGPKIRHHPDFETLGGVNATFISLGEPLQIRTYERGVEAETLACGTGACAAALVVQHHFEKNESFSLLPPSKELLFVNTSPLELIGPVKLIDRN